MLKYIIGLKLLMRIINNLKEREIINILEFIIIRNIRSNTIT